MRSDRSWPRLSKLITRANEAKRPGSRRSPKVRERTPRATLIRHHYELHRTVAHYPVGDVGRAGAGVARLRSTDVADLLHIRNL